MGFLEQLLGIELGLPARFIIAFVAVLVLIGLVAWVFRRLGGGRGGLASPRSRQQRLAVVDAAQVDAKRRLVLVRRDNTEHLILIGGPSDVVVEAQIGRGQPPAERGEPRAAPPSEQARVEPRVPPARDSAYAPARPAPPPQRAPAPQPTQQPARAAPPPQSPPPSTQPRTTAAPRFPTTERSPGSGSLPSAGEPRVAPPATPPPPQAAPGAPYAPSAPHSPPPEPGQASPSDPKLQDMAQRLESALTRPQPRPGAAQESGEPAPDRQPGEVNLYDEEKKQGG